MAVRPVDLDDVDAGSPQVAGQAGPVGTGPFHPDPVDVAEGAHPVQQLTVPARVCRELAGVQQSPHRVQDGAVVGVGVGVDSTDHAAGSWVRTVLVAPVGSGQRLCSHADDLLVAVVTRPPEERTRR